MNASRALNNLLARRQPRYSDPRPCSENRSCIMTPRAQVRFTKRILPTGSLISELRLRSAGSGTRSKEVQEHSHRQLLRHSRCRGASCTKRVALYHIQDPRAYFRCPFSGLMNQMYGPLHTVVGGLHHVGECPTLVYVREGQG